MTQSVLCTACDQPLPEGQRYCGNCGAEVRRAASEDSFEAGIVQSLVDALRRVTIGEYEIREELGRGGMAYVFLAHEISLGRKVALKVLAPHLHLVPGMSTRFLREAQTAAGLEHPNIIPIYARRETPDVVFFTMRYVAGVTLSSLVRQVGPLPIPLVRALLSDIGGALAFAHQHGVLHRDVKPGNVMVGRDGSVFVTDFGIAKQTSGAGLTVTGQLLGTPGYMSPEQCRGADVSPASDQYSLGAMAFELLAGTAPFVGTNALEVMAQQMTQPAPDILAVRPDCPPELAHAVARMLAKDPAARFTSLEEMLWTSRAAPLAPGDPVRTQLMQWVAGPSNARVFSVTPVSPTPRVSDFVPPVREAPPAPPPGAIALTVVEPAPFLSAPTPPVTPVDLAPRPTPAPGSAAGERPTPAGAGAPSPAPVRSPTPAVAQTVVEVPSPPVVAPLYGAAPPMTSTVPVDAPAGRSVSPVGMMGNRWLLAGGGGLAVLVLLLVVWLGRDKTPPPPPPQPPPPSVGFLALSQLPPEATVRVDGAPMPGSLLTLSPGRHSVAIDAAGYTSDVREVEVTAGDTARLAFAGTKDSPPPGPSTGFLVLSRLPRDATVRVDGARARGSRLELSPGRHTVAIDAPGYRSYDAVVNVTAGETARLAFAGTAIEAVVTPPVEQAKPLGRGVMVVRVEPWARISIDGRFAVQDAYLTRDLPEGRHRLRFERDGFATLDTSVVIAAGDTLKRRFTLQPKAP